MYKGEIGSILFQPVINTPSGKETIELPVGGGIIVAPIGIYENLFLSVIGNVAKLELAS